MPRIKGWKHLTFYESSPQDTFEYLEALFRDVIKTTLLADHLPDMLRVVLSINAGRIKPSAILKRLGSHSRRNLLYQAFRDLGRAVCTVFLLEYLSDPEMRSMIFRATNRSESLNHFTKQVSFSKGGTIAEKDGSSSARLSNTTI